MLLSLLEEENRLMLFLDYLIQGIAGKGRGCSGRVAVLPPPMRQSPMVVKWAETLRY
jgi:hypothetical protein